MYNSLITASAWDPTSRRLLLPWKRDSSALPSIRGIMAWGFYCVERLPSNAPRSWPGGPAVAQQPGLLWISWLVLAGRRQCPRVCCRAGESPAAVLAPWRQPVLPRQWKTHWMHKLSFLLSLLAQASGVFMLRSCQQGGKCAPALCVVCSSAVRVFSPLLSERGEICGPRAGKPSPCQPSRFWEIINCCASVSPPISSWLSSVPPQMPPILLQILVLFNCKFSWAMEMRQKTLWCASVAECFSGLTGLVLPWEK